MSAINAVQVYLGRPPAPTRCFPDVQSPVETFTPPQIPELWPRDRELQKAFPRPGPPLPLVPVSAFHNLRNLPLAVLLLQIFTFVMQFLSFGKPNLYLDQTVLEVKP